MLFRVGGPAWRSIPADCERVFRCFCLNRGKRKRTCIPVLLPPSQVLFKTFLSKKLFSCNTTISLWFYGFFEDFK
ncbi:hypothetical protein DESPIG_00970 [Desulfovibrio piger ATCC 29098]|uniref:Uncharacterized protein n=1 Tax=Desulfovibrio piger ATCC 29098 TaxID=411464 RepID=B6WSI1_9BACT|nr:hypothetical protein DESPIG_00970 [Desulfovibrio piger ATCC 29098]